MIGRLTMRSLAFAGLLCACLCLPWTASAQTTTFNGVVKDLTSTPISTGLVTFQLKPGVDTTISGNARFVSTTVNCEIHNPAVVSTSGTGTITVVVGTAQTWTVGDSLIFVGTADAILNGSSVALPYTITAVNSTTSFNFTQSGTHTNGAGGTVGGLYKSGGTGACIVTQNSALTPANTYYQVGLWPLNSLVNSFNTYALGAGPVDISTVVPTPSQMPAYSFLDTFSNQTAGGNKTLTGNVTSTAGQNTANLYNLDNIKWIDGLKYPCTAAGISQAITDAGAGGTVHAEGCVAAFTWSSTIIVTAPVTVWMPCTHITATASMINAQVNGIHIEGCGNGTGDGTGQSGVNAQTWVTASGFSGTTDMFVGATTGTNRNAASTGRLYDFKIRNIYVDMAGVGRRVVYCSSCWKSYITDMNGVNLAGDAGIYIEGGQATDGGGTVTLASYHVHLWNNTMSPPQGNSTTHAYFFDATNAEIGYVDWINNRGDGPCCSSGWGGAAPVYILAGTSSCTNNNCSFDNSTFIGGHVGNPAASVYGIQMAGDGNAVSQTGGRIFNVNFEDLQIERISQGGGVQGTGTAIGCTNRSGTASGTPCMSNYTKDMPSTGGFSNNFDYAHMGNSNANVNSNDGGPEAPFLVTGDTYILGGHAGGFRFESILRPQGNSQDAPGFVFKPQGLAAASFTGVNFHGFLADFSQAALSGTANYTAAFTAFTNVASGTTPSLYSFYCANGDPTAGTTNNFCFEGGGGTVHNVKIRALQVVSDQGSVCTNGELTLSAGWQSTGAATITAVAGNGQTCSWTITTGTTTAANPTVTDTLTNALPAATTVCEMNIHGGTHTAAAGEGFQQTALSATAPVFTFNGTPTAGGTTYFVTRRCGP